jgi:hypothetical protein
MDTAKIETAGNAGRKESKNSLAEAAERLLKRACLVFFILLVLSQAVLTDPSVRTHLNKETIDGVSLGTEAYLYEPCKIELKLSNGGYCPELRVMVNGEEEGAFFGDSILLDLKQGDVVELDASRLLIPTQVEITAVTSNIPQLLGRSFKAASGIVKIAVVRM